MELSHFCTELFTVLGHRVYCNNIHQPNIMIFGHASDILLSTLYRTSFFLPLDNSLPFPLFNKVENELSRIIRISHLFINKVYYI